MNKSELPTHVFKTITYRVMATTVTVLCALSFGLPIEYSALLGLGEIMVKPALYFGHERIWYILKKHNQKSA